HDRGRRDRTHACRRFLPARFRSGASRVGAGLPCALTDALQREGAMDLKGFVDRAKEAANTAAQKAQEAANAISSAAATTKPPADVVPQVEAVDQHEGTELALADG